MRTLILGGARSGKSQFAEDCVGELGRSVVYVATGAAGDIEMADRISAHRARRPDDWITLEVPMDLAEAIERENRPDRAILVDCLTLWLSNIMLADKPLDQCISAVEDATLSADGIIVLVSNEVGLGLVPESSLGRSFRDAQGRLNQTLAKSCDRVVFVAAGLPLVLKGPPFP